MKQNNSSTERKGPRSKQLKKVILILAQSIFYGHGARNVGTRPVRSPKK